MNLCRVCLSTSVDKDIRDLKTCKKKDSKNYMDILYFCLDIHVSEDTKTTTKLCNKCFRKILAYHKFKTLALQNDAYLKTINLDLTVKLERIFDKENEEKSNNLYKPVFTNNNVIEICNVDEFYDDTLCMEFIPAEAIAAHEVKIEPNIKVENVINDSQSDDELLSVIKRIKEEDPSLVKTTPLEGERKGIIGNKQSKSAKIKLETKPRKQICEECGKSVSDIKEHAMKHGLKQDRKRIPCKQCDKTFTTYSARYKHNRVRHLGIRYRCEICGREVSHLNAHMTKFHRPDKLKACCVLCDKRFVNQSMLKIHMLHHTKEKPFECDICQKRFKLKPTMLMHKRQVHEKEKSHLCQFCSKTFFKKYHLQVHLRSHTKEKPFKCVECGNAFYCVTTLKKHQLIHSSEKKYQCDLCDMKFVRVDYLRAHMLCHTKEKRYPCKYCGVKFGRSDHRNRHQFTAHEKHLGTPLGLPDKADQYA
ncbi:hypothetical protein O0L34_g5026 [Tuta absoluta]|nr:hypothetical protein O0L34_g5026 [Tuta absoluta]